jgi:hypothetical protein
MTDDFSIQLIYSYIYDNLDDNKLDDLKNSFDFDNNNLCKLLKQNNPESTDKEIMSQILFLYFYLITLNMIN